jgi:hypothetical protein
MSAIAKNRCYSVYIKTLLHIFNINANSHIMTVYLDIGKESKTMLIPGNSKGCLDFFTKVKPILLCQVMVSRKVSKLVSNSLPLL